MDGIEVAVHGIGFTTFSLFNVVMPLSYQIQMIFPTILGIFPFYPPFPEYQIPLLYGPKYVWTPY